MGEMNFWVMKSASALVGGGGGGLIDRCRLKESTNGRIDRPVWEDVAGDVPTLDHGRRRSKAQQGYEIPRESSRTFRIRKNSPLLLLSSYFCLVLFISL